MGTHSELFRLLLFDCDVSMLAFSFGALLCKYIVCSNIYNVSEKSNQCTVYLFFKSKQSQDAYCPKENVIWLKDRTLSWNWSKYQYTHDTLIWEGFHTTEHLFDQHESISRNSFDRVLFEGFILKKWVKPDLFLIHWEALNIHYELHNVCKWCHQTFLYLLQK